MVSTIKRCADGTLLSLDGAQSLPLGIADSLNYEESSQRLQAHDHLVFYTDGITEACNERGEEFGEQCLIESLRQHRELSCQALLTAIVDGVQQFSCQEQRDDITAIVAKVRATG